MTAEVVRVEGVTRVPRTFAFVDVSGFTAFTDSEGDAAAVAQLEEIRGSIRGLASVFGVRVDKWLGDGAMLVGVEPEPVIEAVVAMVQANRGDLRLRAGIATGDVILFEGDDYIGQAVNLAARLSALAGPGVILAPRTMDSSLLVNTSTEDAGCHRVAGIGEPVDLIKLTPRTS